MRRCMMIVLIALIFVNPVIVLVVNVCKKTRESRLVYLHDAV